MSATCVYEVSSPARRAEQSLDARLFAFFAELERDSRRNSVREREREAANDVDPDDAVVTGVQVSKVRRSLRGGPKIR